MTHRWYLRSCDSNGLNTEATQRETVIVEEMTDESYLVRRLWIGCLAQMSICRKQKSV